MAALRAAMLRHAAAQRRMATLLRQTVAQRRMAA